MYLELTYLLLISCE